MSTGPEKAVAILRAMTEPAWAWPSEPFPEEAVGWHAVAIDRDGQRVRLEPHLSVDAVRARLDDEVGPEAWSLHLRSWGDDGVIVELSVRGVSRSAVVRCAPFAGVSSEDRSLDVGAAATAAAWSAAAAAFGMILPIEVIDGGWVDADLNRGEPLHLPEVRSRGTADQDRAGVGMTPRASGTHDDRSASAATVETSSEPEPKPEAQQVIDRLVERLRSEGLGAETARLIASYGGYGTSPTASRELYAKLRALLLERGAAS